MAWFGKAPKRPAQRKQAQTVAIPAPILGLNTTDDPLQLDPRFATLLLNLIPGEGSVGVVAGDRYQVDSASLQTGTLLPFHGSTSATDKLFASGPDGIYDVTSAAATLSTPVVSFGINSGNAGYANGVTMVTLGGPVLLVCDEANGYYTYSPSGSTWTKVAQGTAAGEISNVDPAGFTFVTVWKNRAWFIQGGTGAAWFLPVGQYAGAAQRFDFGNKFSSGGSLVGLYNWTHDGGAGVDDHLVAVSSNGDVLVYSGTDPAVADAFNLVGSWTTGGLKMSRRFAVNVGGDLWLALATGILPVSVLVSGQTSSPQSFLTYPIQKQYQSNTGFTGLFRSPGESLIILGNSAGSYQSAVRSTAKAWTNYKTLSPWWHSAVFRGATYSITSDAGTGATSIRYNTGATIGQSRAGAAGTAIGIAYASPYVGWSAFRKTWTQARIVASSSITGTSLTVSTVDRGSAAYTISSPSSLTEWNGVAATGDAALIYWQGTTSAASQSYRGAFLQFIPMGDQ